jgi:hypothetical protein
MRFTDRDYADIYQRLDFLETERFITPESVEVILQDIPIDEMWCVEEFITSIEHLRNPKRGVVRSEPLTQAELVGLEAKISEERALVKERQFFDIVRSVEQRMEVLHRTTRGGPSTIQTLGRV